jgi:hypothetical protein
LLHPHDAQRGEHASSSSERVCKAHRPFSTGLEWRDCLTARVTVR